METQLQQLGLNEQQAKTYLHLLKSGPAAPPQIAEQLALTRSNAYKVLDSLVGLGLVERREIQSKLVYYAESPAALESLIQAERSRLMTLEKHAKAAVQSLSKLYTKTQDDQELSVVRGSQAVRSARKKLGKGAKTTATSAAEWAASNDELLITTSGKEPVAFRIKNRAIAKAFAELHKLVNRKV